MNLVTHQTGPEGQKVRRLLIEEGADIRKELYVGMVVDRGTQKVVLMASSEGGMDIEEVAAKTPEKIKKVFIDPVEGLTDADADEIAIGIGIPQALVPQARAIFKALYKCFDETDASLVEVNPLILTGDGRVIALDSKINFDDNALFRHPDIVALRDLDEEDPLEIEASKYELNYISLDGNIACMVNGAGLAMATMDTIKLFGGSPANFLDVGGGATAEKVTAAFKIMLSNKKVKAILVNIFGGIMKCDTIATGVVAAAREVNLKVPLVVRMKGTNEELGKKILKDRPADHRPTTWPTPRRRSSPPSRKAPDEEGRARRKRRSCQEQVEEEGEEEMSILIDRNTRVMTQGITGKTGQFHTQTSRAYANGRACFVAGSIRRSRARISRAFRSSAPSRMRKPHRGHRLGDLRAAALRRGGDRRGGGRGPRPRDLHHRGHPGARHDPHQAPHEGQAGAPRRAQLPRRDHARRDQDRHHAGAYPQERPGRRGVALGHAHLRSGGQLSELGLGQSSCVGIGGDPVNGLKHIDVLRMFNDDPRPRRSSWWARSAARTRRRGAMGQGQHEEAGGRLHRRNHGAAGKAHGPRRHHPAARAPRRRSSR